MTRIGAWWRRRGSRRYWEREWARDDYAPPWLGRGVSREVAAAIDEGWIAAGAHALDIGCGQGEIAARLAERGLPTLGIDIAEAALARARARYGEQPGRLEFRRVDICSRAPASHRFAALVDRGCFHQLGDGDLAGYARNVVRASTRDARLLLFVKAFRGAPQARGLALGNQEEARAARRPISPDGAREEISPDAAREEISRGDSRESVLARMEAPSAERARHIARVEGALGRDFAIERVTATFLDPDDGHGPAAPLPGLVFWMQRRKRSTSGAPR